MDNFRLGTHPQTWEDVKICVYAICKDEEKFVDRWLDSMYCNGNGANYICVLDTGSTDNTVERLNNARFEGCEIKVNQQEISPWRFDTARNAGLNFIPAADKIDVCFCIDLDEIVTSDFWVDLRKIVFEHPDFKRIYYKYAWDPDPITHIPNNFVFWYDKIHGVDGWQWEFPVHETLTCTKSELYCGEYYLDANKIYVYHYPDNTKSRGSYLGLLKTRCDENPTDLYGRFYLGREYGFHSDYHNQISQLLPLYNELLLRQSIESVNVLNSDRLFFPTVCVTMGRAYELCGAKDEAMFYYDKSIKLYPDFGYGYIRLAQTQAYAGKYLEAQQTINELLKNINTCRTLQDWRAPQWALSNWKINQILGDAYCWQGRIEDSLKAFILANSEIVSESDRNSAVSEGFYNDYAFIQNKAKELGLIKDGDK